MVEREGLSIAVIGVGGWGKNHARVLNDLGCLGAICDVDGARAKELAIKYGVRSYSSLDELLDKEKLDGCLVCTPTKTHAVVAKKVMERGVNAFVEKPMSFSSKECEELSEVSDKSLFT
jgi:UDP-N-acetylglucosamine 3-dehydrogenase